MYTERSESTQILSQAATFEVAAGQCGAQDGSKPQIRTDLGLRRPNPDPSEEIDELEQERVSSRTPTHLRNGVECRRRSRPQVGGRVPTRAVGTG